MDIVLAFTFSCVKPKFYRKRSIEQTCHIRKSLKYADIFQDILFDLAKPYVLACQTIPLRAQKVWFGRTFLALFVTC